MSADPAPARRQVNFDDVLEKCCGTGSWQILLVSYMSLMFFMLPFFSMSMMFAGATPDFKCADGFPANSSFSSLPDNTPKCEVRGNTSAPNGDPVPCSRWVFDRSVYTSTAVSEWNLVCNRKPLLSMLQSLLMLGGLVGALIVGSLADRLGRKPVFLGGMLVTIGMAFAAAMVSSYNGFAVIRFFTGYGMATMIGSQFVLVMELGSPKQRAMFGLFYMLPFAFGIMLVAGVAYALRERWLLQLALAGPTLLLLPTFWLMPESPRWLILRGRFQQALQVLSRGVKYNGKKMPTEQEVLQLMKDVRDTELAKEQEITGDGPEGRLHQVLEQILQLFRTPRMRRNMLISMFCWFVVAGTYFGIAFDTTQLSESPHLAAFLSGLVELPCYLISPIVNRLGRRITISISFLLTAASMFLIFVTKDATYWLILGLVGKFGATTAFNLVLIYTPEYIPTRIRASGMGFCQVFSRLGSAVAPFVVDLVSDLHESAPSAVFGTFALLAGLAVFLLPETKNCKLPETVADVEETAQIEQLKEKEHIYTNVAFISTEIPPSS